jgi:hypothetical protein
MGAAAIGFISGKKVAFSTRCDHPLQHSTTQQDKEAQNWTPKWGWGGYHTLLSIAKKIAAQAGFSAYNTKNSLKFSTICP